MNITHPPRLFTAAGMALACGMMTIGLFGFPPFHLGYWNAEPITLSMFVVGTLIGVWLTLGAVCGWITFRMPRGHMLITVWLAWLGWQALATAFSARPWRSWFGPPEQSEGLAWYICASLFMLLLAQLWHHAGFRKLLLGLMVVIMAALACLHLVSDEGNNTLAGFFFSATRKPLVGWLPFVWPDYLGYMAAWGWIALQLTFPGMRRRWNILLGVLVLFVVFASSNRAAFFLIGYATLVSVVVGIIRGMGTRHFSHVSRTWRQLAIIACLLPVGWLVASPYIPANYSAGESQSVPTRILLNHISMTAIADHPSRLLVGNGWGQFADDFFKYSLVRDVRIYDDGRHQPNWPLVRGYNYHSHNMASETLLSLGLVGMLLWLILPVIAIRALPGALFWPVVPMLVAVTLLQHVWFVMPQTMPFQALAWFLLMRQIPAAKSYGQLRRTHLLPAGALVVALLSWSATAQYDAIRYSMRLSDPFGQRYGKAATAALMQEDIIRGGDRLRSFFINTTKRIARNEGAVQTKHVALYKDYLDSMEALAKDPATGAYNGAAVLYGYNVLITTLRHPLLTECRQKASANYFAMAKLHTARAPYREDAIAPFLDALWNLPSDTEHRKLLGIVQELLAIHPAHRSGLWLGGEVLAKTPAFAAQGQEMMGDALRMGADRIYLIPKDATK